jgi:imidazoleglycerol-phosphate dehydratase
MESTEKVLQMIIQYQNNNSLSDQQMAEKIGCSRPLYQRTRTGRIPMGGTFIRGAMQVLAETGKQGRKSTIQRITKETNIYLELNIDGTGEYNINTGVRIFDHMLSHIAKHGVFDIKITAAGDDIHHLVEDVAICLGKAFGEALGEKRGIVRMASASVPMDETLATVVVDISGRGYPVIKAELNSNDMPGLPVDLVRHFLESFAIEAWMNLHASIVYGTNDHHKAEALFKALGRALDAATRIDERIANELPSTKAYLEK